MIRNLLKPQALPAPSELTSEVAYFDRRRLLTSTMALMLTGKAGTATAAAATLPALEAARNARFSAAEPLTSYEDITTYNNFYEFGTDKADPQRAEQERESGQ